jgi:hypothetical protein
MILSQFGSYYLPPAKTGALVMGGTYQDAFETSDEMDGEMPLMGTNPAPLGQVTIQVTFSFRKSFLSKPIPNSGSAYALNDGGLDAALFDFSLNVLYGGVQTLTAIPSPGTAVSPLSAGVGTITSWTADAQTAQSYQITRNPNDELSTAEVDVVFLIESTVWTVNASNGHTFLIPVV